MKKSRLAQFMLVCLVCFSINGFAITSTWTCGTGNYSNTSCWNPFLAVPPCNYGAITFDVTIPDGSRTISMNTGTCEVSSLYLGQGNTFKVLSGNSYSITGQADIDGHIWGNGGDFSAPITDFIGDKLQFTADNGSHIWVGGDPNYSSAGLAHTTTFFNATGIDTQLNLPSLQTLDVQSIPGGTGAYHKILASNNAQISLPALTNILGPMGADYLYIQANNGGTIDLSSLESITAADATTAFTYFYNSTGVMDLPALTTAEHVQFYCDGGGVINVGSLTDYSSAGLAHTTAFFNATGSGTEINLPALQTINVQSIPFSGGFHKIYATNNAQINLPALTNILGPTGSDYLYIQTIGGGSIDLSSLESITAADATTAFTYFYAQNSVMDLPALTTAEHVNFYCEGGSIINVDSLTDYSSAGLAHTTAFFNATGPGTQLNLPSLQTLDVQDIQASGGYHQILASNNAQINMPALTTILGPMNADYLYIQPSSGGSIDLSSLESITAADTSTAFTYFHINTGVMDLPALTTAEHVNFYCEGGSIINVDSLTDYSSAGLAHTTAFFNATGTGTQLNLPSLQTLDVQDIPGSGAWHKIIANANSCINMPDLTNILGPIGVDYFYINITNGSKMIMGDLDITSATKVPITLSGGSFLKMGGLRASEGLGVTISMNAPTDLLEITGDFKLASNITFNNPGDGILSLGGDLSYAHTDETLFPFGNSYVYLNGKSPQIIEVGGWDASTFIELIPNDNFGYGQMIVGQCDQPSLVQLVDEIDNGNLNGLGGFDEALYLFGKDGSDGLRILGVSTLMIGDLNVYTMKDGTMQRVRDWFAPGETMIPYDEGYIMLGNPDIDHVQNLILNGGFETGTTPPDAGTLFATLGAGSTDIDNWTIAGEGIDWCHDALFNDADDTGVLSVDLSGDPAGCGVISQDVPTQVGHRYFVWFNMSYNPLGNVYGEAGEKTVEVRAAGQSQQFTIDSTIDPGQWPVDPNSGWTVPWVTMTTSFVADDTTTTLEFACLDDPATAFGVAIDNVVVIEGGELLSLIPGDLTGNRVVNIEDLGIFCSYWLSQDCNGLEGCWCGGADLDKDGDVDMQDFAILAGNWLGSWQTADYSLSISSTAGGSVVDPGEGSYSWVQVTQLPVEAAADTHYEFSEWTGTAVDNGKVTDPYLASTEVNVDGNYTLKANFQKVTYTLTTSSTTGGSVTVPGEGAFSYEAQTLADVTAVADSHQHFVSWTGTAVTAGKVANPASPATTVLMDADYTLNAVFSVDVHTLDLSSGQGGQVTQPGEGVFSYAYGSTPTVQAAADMHYSFTEWTGTAVTAGKVANPTSDQTAVTVDADYTLVANFQRNQYSVTIDSTVGGSVTVPGEGVFSYDAEQQITLTAAADAHYHFVGWTGPAVSGGMVTDPGSAATTLTVNGNTAVTAVFEADMLDLTIDSTAGGSVTDPGEGTFGYAYGTVVSVTASADSGNQFVQWTGTAVTAGKVPNPDEASTTVTVDGVYTLTAEFEQKPIETVYDFTLDSNPGWSMTGQWEYGTPTGNGGIYFGYPDPTSGNTGSSVIGVNLSGDYALAIGGPYTLTAGPFDLSGYQDASIDFASWLNTDFPQYVKHMLEVSTDGNNWNIVWEHTSPTDITDSQWSELTYDISTWADGQSSVYLRWSYEVLADRAYPYSGWNLDDIMLRGRQN